MKYNLEVGQYWFGHPVWDECHVAIEKDAIIYYVKKLIDSKVIYTWYSLEGGKGTWEVSQDEFLVEFLKPGKCQLITETKAKCLQTLWGKRK